MIIIKNQQAQEKMAVTGSLLARLFDKLTAYVQPGVTTESIDNVIDRYLSQHELVSSTRGYMGYKHVSCISLNDEVVHGIPHKGRLLRENDLVKVDVCASYNGYCADMARCFYVGQMPAAIKEFVSTAQHALDKGIEQAYVGNRLSSISAAIQEEVEKQGFGVVRDFAGHGIGKKMHEDPEILNYGEPGCGPVLQAGMAFAIEPMITMGSYQVFVDSDGWTVKTMDGSLAAHVEDTVLVTESGPRIVTRL